MVREKSKSKVTFDDEYFLPDLEFQKQYILDNFDFERVVHTLHMKIHKDYDSNEYSEWKMACRNGYKVPDVAELKKLAIDLMNGAIKCKQENYYAHCGPFRIIKMYDRLILDFVITSWSYD